MAWIARRNATAAAVSIAVIALLATGRQLLRAPDLRHALGAPAAATAILEILPPHTLLLTGYHETQFLLWEARSVEGARPDICAIYRHDLPLPGAWISAVKQCPDLAKAAPAQTPPTIHGMSTLSAAGLVALSRNRFVAIEPDSNRDDPFPVTLGNFLRPAGPIAFLQPERRGPRWNPADIWRTFDSRMFPWRHESGTRHYLLWRRYQDAVLLARQRRCPAAWPSFRRAWSLSPNDPFLVQFAKKCFPNRPLP